MERAADMLRMAIPMLRGTEQEETAVKCLSAIIKTLPGAKEATPMPGIPGAAPPNVMGMPPPGGGAPPQIPPRPPGV